MLLKNFMEEKQLDYNQPFLSARRFSSTEDNKKADNSHCNVPSLPFYKSELKSGPVRMAGAVPFLWEQSPGRPKNERGSQNQVLDRPPIAPKLPPGRIANAKHQIIDKLSEDPEISRPQTARAVLGSNDVSSSDEIISKYEISKNDEEEKQSSGSENGDETYVDALDTLSRTESFFLNCSVSGLSGLDGPVVKQCGNFSTDPQTRDFMMGRFLPAAKAIASEAPQYASRKQHVPREQPRQQKVINPDKQNSVYSYRSNVVPHYAQNHGEEESEDEDGDYDEPGNLSGKLCGLLPRSCLKNSISMLNSVPGMKIGVSVPASSVRRVRAKSSYAGARSETRNMERQGGVHATELREGMNNLKAGCTHQMNSRNPGGSSLYRRLQGGIGGGSLYNNESFQSLSHEGKSFLGNPYKANHLGVDGVGSNKKDVNTFRDLIANERTEWESGSVSPVVEKTLYIDTVHIAKSPSSNSSSSDKKGRLDPQENDSRILLKTGEMEETFSLDSSLLDIKHVSFADEKVTLLPQTMELEMDMVKGDRHNRDLTKDFISLEELNLCDDGKGKMDLEDNHRSPETEDQDNYHDSFPGFPLPPPLPKSPSESWLNRTLPSVSSRNQSSHSFLGTRMHHRLPASKTSAIDPKWERIVKTSNLHPGHLRFSEELLTPIPET